MEAELGFGVEGRFSRAIADRKRSMLLHSADRQFMGQFGTVTAHQSTKACQHDMLLFSIHSPSSSDASTTLREPIKTRRALPKNAFETLRTSSRPMEASLKEPSKH